MSSIGLGMLAGGLLTAGIASIVHETQSVGLIVAALGALLFGVVLVDKRL